MTFGNFTIKTNFDYPPIPLRSMDWSAWIDGREDWHVGRGRTELDALMDLHEMLVNTGWIADSQWLHEFELRVRSEYTKGDQLDERIDG